MKRACQQVGACLHPVYIALVPVLLRTVQHKYNFCLIYIGANKCVKNSNKYAGCGADINSNIAIQNF